jgi:hypothetical protein
MARTAVDCFYRIAFPNERSFWTWTERVLEFATLVLNARLDDSDARAVIFVPQWPTPGKPFRAYVSVGARGVAMRLSDGALIDRSVTLTAAELPPGLTMLIGSEVDEAEYENMHAWRDCARRGIS